MLITEEALLLAEYPRGERKEWTLINEIKADEIKVVQYTADCRRKVTPFRTDEEEPVPKKSNI